jgi:hypothetical protein
VILEPGVYTIAEDLPRKTDFYYDARPTVDLAGVRVTGNVFGLGLGGDPKINIGLLTNYGPDFEAVSVSAPLSAVPEPSSIALSGLMAAGVLARYYHAKRKAVAV